MFFDNYQEKYLLLSNREAEVIDYLLKQDSIENVTLKSISQDLLLSSSTVIRACKKMGYESYSELKYNLQFSKRAQENSENKKQVLSWDYFKNQLSLNLQQNLDIFCEEDFNLFAEHILKARRVFCIGIGSSSMVASDFNRKLKLVNIWSNDYYEQHSIQRVCDIATDQDVILIFSLSGSDGSINKVLMSAKQRHTTILAVTSFNSPLVQMSDQTICVYNSPSTRQKLRHRLNLNVVEVLLFESLIMRLDNYL
ncbi:MurR/RpiR family transcriptional regulator [Streptococcus didelphis]|uniref:MurR/RpiR family transcriptional regulator n=1 Tax=Streptococcus didelphis TaxID=102886 RepID=A0ABY9LFL4_9STRE|nr:MurR/RpiR family transcriptional regulator [Streptococcus didelphis]WMB27707.1 MurR/RpiR family transcriptional regulator [Streptococcus didelphis]WMB29832.1 MurR/RpiR family transcriptional regulator [Streptococcus didelphis]